VAPDLQIPISSALRGAVEGARTRPEASIFHATWLNDVGSYGEKNVEVWTMTESTTHYEESQGQENRKRKAPTSPFENLRQAVQQFVQQHPHDDSDKLLAMVPKRWSLYPPMILLPPSTFTSAEWKAYLSSLPELHRLHLFATMAKSLKVSHLATNAPIQSNTTRSPRITPLHGDFGPLIDGRLTPYDFDVAFWATSTQNGIKQTWAPMYTMFSRGNITEKARVLTFPDVRDEEIADLFVGIGYFTFSYVKAGAKRVWGWDLNAWSVEGLRRGAEMNGWKCAVNGDHIEGAKVIVYNEDNGKAGSRLEAAAVKVKHVNLGLLPSSQDSWGIAASILNDQGGWIHVHGNYKDSEIDIWAQEITLKFTELFGSGWIIQVGEKFRVKEYGPGVGHWVLDVECTRLTSVAK
jgi:tRNA wybutosine-synthesizing protein 2